MPHIITESEVEEAALEILEELGYEVVHGPDIAPDGTSPERQSYADVLPLGRLKDAVDRLNPKAPRETKEEAIRQILRSESPDLVLNNRRFHKMLADGVDVEYRLPAGRQEKVIEKRRRRYGFLISTIFQTTNS